MLIPKPLCKGDTVALLSASGPCCPVKLKNGVRRIEALGLNVRVMESCFLSHGYLAGDDKSRLKDLHMAFADKNIKGVLAARGGYGAARLLPFLDYDMIRQNPKRFIGFSDVTALHTVFNRWFTTFHGPMPVSCFGEGEPHPLTMESYKNALFGDGKFSIPCGLKTLYPGKLSGVLTGGNLSVIASTLGTAYEIDTRERILFLEEIQEEPYRIDRLLLQVKLAGKFRDAAGIIFGDFSPENLDTLGVAVRELVLSEKKPTLWGLQCGHAMVNLTLPLGGRVE